MGCGDESLSGGSPVLECWALKLGEQVNDARADNVQRRASEEFLGINEDRQARFLLENGTERPRGVSYIRDVLDAAEREGYSMPHYQVALRAIQKADKKAGRDRILRNCRDIVATVAVASVVASAIIKGIGVAVAASDDKNFETSRREATAVLGTPYTVDMPNHTVYRGGGTDGFRMWTFPDNKWPQECTVTKRGAPTSIFNFIVSSSKYQFDCKDVLKADQTDFARAFEAFASVVQGRALPPGEAKAVAEGYLKFRRLSVSSLAAK